MRILFETDNDSYFAISQREVYKGKMHEELLWAELQPTADGRIKIVWEDNWQQPVFCNDLAQAKSSVIAEHGNHKPHINGRSYEIG